MMVVDGIRDHLPAHQEGPAAVLGRRRMERQSLQIEVVSVTSVAARVVGLILTAAHSLKKAA